MVADLGAQCDHPCHAAFNATSAVGLTPCRSSSKARSPLSTTGPQSISVSASRLVARSPTVLSSAAWATRKSWKLIGQFISLGVFCLGPPGELLGVGASPRARHDGRGSNLLLLAVPAAAEARGDPRPWPARPAQSLSPCLIRPDCDTALSGDGQPPPTLPSTLRECARSCTASRPTWTNSPHPAGSGPEHRRHAARPQRRAPPLARRAGPRLPNLLLPQGVAGLLHPRSWSGPGTPGKTRSTGGETNQRARYTDNPFRPR